MTTNGDVGEPEIRLQFKDETTPEETTKKKRSCIQFRDNFGDYSENTTLHGFKYLGEAHRPISEKIWWAIGFLICVSCLGYFIYIIVDKWQKSPVIVTTDHFKTPIYKVPFPAVTICPDTKMKLGKFDYTEIRNQLRQHSQFPESERATNESIKYFEMMSHLCIYQNFLSTDQSLWKGNTVMDKSDVAALLDLAPSFNDFFVSCRWGNETNCTKLLSPIITDEGRCYTFNIMTGVFRNEKVQNDYFYFDAHSPKKHWTFDDGYTSHDIADAHPKRGMAMGKNDGLSLTLRSYHDDLNYLCRGGDQGYKVTMHHPSEFPHPKKLFIRVPHGENADIAVTPHTIKTASTINSYSPERRQCYFNHERSLRFFLTYNQMNCKLECVANLMQLACDCVKFSLPRARGVPICGVEKIACYAPLWTEWENHVLLKQFKEEYYGKNESNINDRALDKCNCLPECSLVEYKNSHEFTHYDLEEEMEEFPELIKIYDDGSSREYAITKISVYFANTHFYGETRSELYGISDLVSQFGGLLGLFMGGSVFSLVELIYFCTIRSLCRSNRASLDTGVA